MAIVMSDVRRMQVEDFHVLVHAGYPKAFARPNGSGHVPLKIGMIDDLRIAFPAIEKSVIEMFMDIYTSSKDYQKTCSVAGASRVGLTGELRGKVTEAQAASARRNLSRFKSNPLEVTAEEVCAKTGKVGYRTGGDALENARHARLEDSERREIDAFRCSSCDRFHWGHKKPWSYVPRAMRAEIAQVERHVV
ncbi:ProP expression regulator [compost metagenome]